MIEIKLNEFDCLNVKTQSEQIKIFIKKDGVIDIKKCNE